MKKKYLYYIILIMYSPFIFAQTVSINSIYVNSVYSQSINLGSNSSSNVTLSVLVTLPATQSNSNPGTINVYYKRNNSASAIVGGYGGNLLFNGGTNATRGFSINLSASEFDTSGGILYAEYKTFLGIIYKSGNISIIKNADTGGGGTLIRPDDAPNPAKIANTLCCNQTVRLGDKPQTITGSQYSNPYANYSYGINESWSANGNRGIQFLDFKSSALNIDYITDPQNFTITRSLGYNNTSNLTNKSNTITITVVPSPILKNEISVNLPINPNGFIEIINTNNSKPIYGTRYSGQVNLNILQDPFHVSQRGDNFTEIERFEWQYTKTNSALGGKNNWITIDGENNYFLETFTPPDISNTEDNYYLLRRIAIYQNIKKVSNTLKIVYRTIRKNNTICCDQALTISAANTISVPTLIVGSDATPEANQYLKYQWQSQSIDNNNSEISNWSNIIGATSKDYLPPTLQLVSSSRRGEITWSTPVTYNYRRVTEPQYYNGEFTYSNEVNLSSISYKNSEPSVIVYPNPATSIINIENIKGDVFFNIATISVSISNINGQIVNSNNYSIISPTKISMDISSLPLGTYFINFNTGDRRSTKVTFYKTN